MYYWLLYIACPNGAVNQVVVWPTQARATFIAATEGSQCIGDAERISGACCLAAGALEGEALARALSLSRSRGRTNVVPGRGVVRVVELCPAGVAVPAILSR